MENKKSIVAGLVVFGVMLLMAGIWYVQSKDGEEEKVVNVYTQEVSPETPVNVVLDFYNPWLEAVRSTSTDPYTLGLAVDTILSENLRTRLVGTAGHPEIEIDPVLCQTTTPLRVTGRIVSSQENEVRVLIMAKEKELTGQSVFSLKRLGEGWFIDDILCSPGEFDIPREFSFEKEGYLLKSVPPPYDPEFWHIVFEENGEPGHVVPLHFSDASSCVSTDRIERACVLGEFTEAVKVHVYGQMTESGADVKRLEFLE
jgi:hypothetical protein